MTDWRVVDLVQHWKHGWIPLTLEAKAIKAKQKSGHVGGSGVAVQTRPINEKANKAADLVDEGLLTEDQARSLPNHLKFKLPRDDPHEWRAKIREHVGAGKPAASKAPDKPKTPASPIKAAKPKVKAPEASPATADRGSLSDAQSQALDRIEQDRWVVREQANDKQFDREWESATRIEGGGLTLDENRAIDLWQNGYSEDPYGDAGGEVGHYITLNNMLRGTGGVDGLDEESLAELDEINYGLDSALAKSKVTRDLTVFRGVTDMQDVKIGDTLTDPGWAATTLNPRTAAQFMAGEDRGGQWGGRVKDSARLLVIRVPKGKNALRVDDPSKHEVVLGPGTPMRVVRIEGNRVYVEVQ